MVASIKVKKADLLLHLRTRLGAGKIDSLPDAAPPVMDVVECNAYLVANAVLLNKVELENLFDAEHYGAGSGKVDMQAFLAALKADEGGVDPIPLERYPPNDPNMMHLALSGESHCEFGMMYKPYPKHWGTPPNAQMKGHDGIMRELPGGYGKGNAPMYNWVHENLQKDRKTSTDARGRKPFPFGNYSL